MENKKIKKTTKKACLPKRQAYSPKRRACSPKRRGFSLLELLVVIALVGIMTAVAFIPLAESRKRKAVETSARKVTAVIREAQNNAFSGKNADVYNAWTVLFKNPSINEFQLIGSFAGGNDLIATYKLDNNTSFKGLGFNLLFFSIPFASVSGFSYEKITICDVSEPSICQTICINSAGNIEEKTGDATCP